MNYTIGDLAEISKRATEKVVDEYKKFGWQNPPAVTIAMSEAVLEAAQHSARPTALCGGHEGGSDVKHWICQTCGLPIPHSH